MVVGWTYGYSSWFQVVLGGGSGLSKVVLRAKHRGGSRFVLRWFLRILGFFRWFWIIPVGPQS